MGNLSAAQVESDVTLLLNSLNANQREIPSTTTLLKRSSAVPLFSAVLSVVSTVIFYVSFYKEESSVNGFLNFFLSQGWYLLAITVAVGFLVFLMTYNNQITYMSLPSEVRSNSLVINHLAKIVRKSVFIFCASMIVCCLLSGVSAWFAVAVPALLLLLFVISSILVSAEINRLGAGMALEKVSNLLKKI